MPAQAILDFKKIFKNLRAPATNPTDNIATITHTNAQWMYFMSRGQKISFEKREIINPQSKIFCIGSCFALEIKRALKERGYAIHPREENMQVANTNDFAKKFVHYNTFAIRQEFEKAFGIWTQNDEDVWPVKLERKRVTQEGFQDPYRRKVVENTREELLTAIRAMDDVCKKGIHESDIYIITLGLIEVWKKKNDGRYAGAAPGYSGGGGYGLTSFVKSTFKENYENCKAIVELIRAHFPGRQIIFSVSPVPMATTFTKNDVYVANMESKSLLRAVAGQICEEYDNAHYFPSYEICNLLASNKNEPVYGADGRHVRSTVVNQIIEIFLKTHTKHEK